MHLSVEAAIILTVFAAAMWGSWMQVVKHVKDYPITGVVFWLYAFSFILIWAITLIVAPHLLSESIWTLTLQNIPTILKIMLGGGMMSVGLFISLQIMGKIGLILSTTVSGGVGVILGLVTSIVEEGVPEGGLFMIILTALVYILAGFVSSYASKCRDEDRGIKDAKVAVDGRIVFLMLVCSLLTNGWSIGTATGTARGLAPVLTCAYMATGSFLSVLLVCLVFFTYKKMWKKVLCINESKKPIWMSAICACCHYGGNLISIYSMPALTATVSFLLGRTSNLWTIFWGMYYKEFSGISRRTKFVLASAIFLFLFGTVLLTIYKFG